MTITNASAPLFAVVGATGVQGGSVIRALKASSKAYRVRAITRDPSKPAVKELEALGCEVVSADVSTLEGANKAFHGADFAFAMTVTDYSKSAAELKSSGYASGKAQVDAAKAAGVKVLAWPGLLSMEQLSGGKVPVPHFDVKAEVTAYARSVDGLKFLNILPGAYATNYFTASAPRKQDDGSFIFAVALEPDTLLPVIDMEADYGRYVVAAVENGGPETVYAAPEYITPVKIAEEFAKASGKQVTFVRVPDEQMLGLLKSNVGETMATLVMAMFRSFKEVGYYAGNDLKESNAILDTPARTFGETLAANKDVVARLFA